MAARTFRVIIRNRTANFVLSSASINFNHLCDGGWTGGWAPPGVICFPNPGTKSTIFVCPNATGQGAMQSESDWAFGSTDGYVKYDVLDASTVSGKRVGMMYVYWSNPFYGTTQCRFATNSSDVAPDCDFSGPGQGSVVPPGPKDAALPFHVIPSWGVVVASDGHGMHPVNGSTDDDPQEADFAAGVAAFAAGAAVGVGVGGVVTGIGDLAAVNGIVDHAWIQLDVFDGPPQSVPSLAGSSAAVQTVSQDTNAPSQQWAGHWVGDKVVVDISISGPANSGLMAFPPLSVSVQDSTATPPITFTVPVNLASQLVRPATSQAAAAAAASSGSSAHASLGPRANSMISSTRSTTQPRANTVVASTRAGAESSANTSVRLRGMEFQRDANGVAYIEGVIYLPNSIILRLYKQFEGGTLSAFLLGYQRIGANGKMATNQMLVRPIKI